MTQLASSRSVPGSDSTLRRERHRSRPESAWIGRCLSCSELGRGAPRCRHTTGRLSWAQTGDSEVGGRHLPSSRGALWTEPALPVPSAQGCWHHVTETLRVDNRARRPRRDAAAEPTGGVVWAWAWDGGAQSRHSREPHHRLCPGGPPGDCPCILGADCACPSAMSMALAAGSPRPPSRCCPTPLLVLKDAASAFTVTTVFPFAPACPSPRLCPTLLPGRLAGAGRRSLVQLLSSPAAALSAGLPPCPSAPPAPRGCWLPRLSSAACTLGPLWRHVISGPG